MKSTILARISLVWLLVGGAVAEVLFNRLGLRVFGTQPTSVFGASVMGDAGAQTKGNSLGLALEIIDWLGLFFVNFTSILALVLCTWALVVLVRDAKLFDLPSRAALVAVATLFLPLAGSGLFWRLSPVLAPFLNATFCGVALILLIAFVRRAAPWRAKAAVAYIVAVMVLHSYWLYSERLALIASHGLQSMQSVHTQMLTSHLVVAGAAVAYVGFAPVCCKRKALFALGPLATSGVVALAAAILVQVDYVWAELVARYGLGIELPPPASLLLNVYVAALLPFTLLLLGLIRQRGGPRAVGLGLVLLVLAGGNLRFAYQILLALAGLIQIIRGLMCLSDADVEDPLVARLPDVTQWKVFLNNLVAASQGQPRGGDAVVLQQQGRQVARVCGTQADMPYAVRLLTKGGQIEQLEVDIGHPPKDEPPVALLRRRGLRARRLSHRRGPRGKEFERDFLLRDDTGEFSDLFVQLIGALRVNVHGWLAIWPAEGVRYVSRPEPSGWPVPLAEVLADATQANTDAFRSLVDFLLDIASKADISGPNR